MTEPVSFGRHWHDILRDLTVAAAGVAIVVTMISGFINSREANRNTGQTLNDLEQLLSLGTKAQQAAQTRAAIIQIECGTREAIVDSFRALNPTLHLHLPAVPGIPATPAVKPLPGKPNTGIPAIPMIPGCPPIDI